MILAHSPCEYASFTSSSLSDRNLDPGVSFPLSFPDMHVPNGVASCAISIIGDGGTPTLNMPCCKKNEWND